MPWSHLTTAAKTAAAGIVLGLASVAGAPASAADLNGYGGGRGGSLKDGAVPVEMRSAAGPCYLRADTGYSMTSLGETTITQTQHVAGVTTPVTERIANASLANTWLLEGGVGCSWGGSRGIRVEGVIGMHGDRKLTGNVPSVWGPNQAIEANVRSYTAMLNAYRDLGNYAGFVPYIGAGVGLAFNDVDKVDAVGASWSSWHTFSGANVSLAWSLMAGVGYQLTDRAILDVGYRYLNLGKAGATFTDTCHDPATCGPTGAIEAQNLKIKDNSAHEIKVGLRYHYGSDTGTVAGFR